MARGGPFGPQQNDGPSDLQPERSDQTETPELKPPRLNLAWHDLWSVITWAVCDLLPPCDQLVQIRSFSPQVINSWKDLEEFFALSTCSKHLNSFFLSVVPESHPLRVEPTESDSFLFHPLHSHAWQCCVHRDGGQTSSARRKGAKLGKTFVFPRKSPYTLRIEKSKGNAEFTKHHQHRV